MFCVHHSCFTRSHKLSHITTRGQRPLQQSNVQHSEFKQIRYVDCKLCIIILVCAGAFVCVYVLRIVSLRIMFLRCGNALKNNHYSFLDQLASYSHLLILPFFVFSLCARTRLDRGVFRKMQRLSGTLSLTKSGHPTPFHPSGHLLRLLFKLLF